MGSIQRRSFIKSASGLAGALTLPAKFYGKALGANDRINVGIIGTGGKGFDHMNWLERHASEENVRITAVCDVYRRRLNKAMQQSQAEGFMDYRKLLERKDVDAVFIVTPDHWHSKMSIEAMEAGKHVYCEKPMTLTVDQAIEVRNTVRRLGKVFQVGPGATANPAMRKAQEIIHDGRIGKVTWGMAGVNRNIRGCAFNVWFPIDETAGPGKQGDDQVDWEMWLGHQWGLAPKIPWNPEHFFRFRKYWPYNGGVATDLIYHVLAPLLLAIAGNNGAYPSSVSAHGGLYIEKDGREIPDVFMMTADYPAEFTLHLMSALTNDSSLAMRICGKYGTLELERRDHSLQMIGNGDFVKEFREGNNGYSDVVLPTESGKDIQGNFFDVIRNGGTLACNAELGAATMVAIKLAVDSYRQNKVLRWDAVKERVVS